MCVCVCAWSKGWRTTQHAVRSCGHRGEMPLKIMLNVRDTQTHSGRRWVPLSTAKPIYCNTRERSIKPHTHTHRHTVSSLHSCLAGKHRTLEPPSFPSHTPLKHRCCPHTGERSCCLGQNTNSAYPETSSGQQPWLTSRCVKTPERKRERTG